MKYKKVNTRATIAIVFSDGFRLVSLKSRKLIFKLSFFLFLDFCFCMVRGFRIKNF